MNKFDYILGWLAVIGAPSVTVGFVVVSIFEGFNYIVLKVIWMPFVFLWGLGRVRRYRYEQSIKKIAGHKDIGL